MKKMIDDTRHGHHQQHHPSRSTVRPYLLNISDDISLAGRQDLAVRPESVDEFRRWSLVQAPILPARGSTHQYWL